MKVAIQLTAFLLVIVVQITTFVYGARVPIAKQQTALLALRDMSAVIFAIMGAWIAVLHPSILKHLTKNNGDESADHDLPSSKHLITPMVYAAFAIVYSMMFGIAWPIMEQLIESEKSLIVVQSLSFGLLSAFTLLLIYALILAFYPYMLAKIRAKKEELKANKQSSLFALTQKKRKE